MKRDTDDDDDDDDNDDGDDDDDDDGDVDDVSSSVNRQSDSKYARHIQEISPSFC